jgi:hypothetical protein
MDDELQLAAPGRQLTGDELELVAARRQLTDDAFQ